MLRLFSGTLRRDISATLIGQASSAQERTSYRSSWRHVHRRVVLRGIPAGDRCNSPANHLSRRQHASPAPQMQRLSASVLFL